MVERGAVNTEALIRYIVVRVHEGEPNAPIAEWF
jgi:hypothetical protein